MQISWCACLHSGLILSVHFASDQRQQERKIWNTGEEVLAFFRHVGVHALCICLREVVGPCWYSRYLFFSSRVCVCVCVWVRWKLRLVHAGRTGAGSFFIPLLCALSGEALSPAICLPALGIVIPKYRPVNISLVTATSPPQHARKKGEQSWSGKEMLLVSLFL